MRAITSRSCSARSSCPYVPGKRYRNWHLPDPKGESIEQVRELRDEIEGRVEALLRELDAASVPAEADTPKHGVG